MALNRLLDGFDGRLTSSRWARINHCSQDSANRDIRDFLDRGLLVRGPGGGRATSYELATGSDPDLEPSGRHSGPEPGF